MIVRCFRVEFKSAVHVNLSIASDAAPILYSLSLTSMLIRILVACCHRPTNDAIRAHLVGINSAVMESVTGMESRSIEWHCPFTPHQCLSQVLESFVRDQWRCALQSHTFATHTVSIRREPTKTRSSSNGVDASTSHLHHCRTESATSLHVSARASTSMFHQSQRKVTPSAQPQQTPTPSSYRITPATPTLFTTATPTVNCLMCPLAFTPCLNCTGSDQQCVLVNPQNCTSGCPYAKCISPKEMILSVTSTSLPCPTNSPLPSNYQSSGKCVQQCVECRRDWLSICPVCPFLCRYVAQTCSECTKAVCF